MIIVEADTWHCRGSTPANYTLKYNLMPFVGILTYGEVARVTEPIEFPMARERVE
jgi:signal peptidase complex subunit 3